MRLEMTLKSNQDAFFTTFGRDINADQNVVISYLADINDILNLSA